MGLINVSFFVLSSPWNIRDCLRKKEWWYKIRGGDINSRKGEEEGLESISFSRKSCSK